MTDELLVYEGLQSCPYLDGRVARMPLYRQLRRLSPQKMDERFALAERRVGSSLYKTECPTCTECKGLRIPVADFRPSKSQRRVANRWGDDWTIEVEPASFSQEKLDLFNKHKITRGLAEADGLPMGASGYVGWLVHSCAETIEMRYRKAGKLVGVGILDLGKTAASSVYFYFDPDASKLSPGVFSVLQEVEFCRRTGREHLYLGLYVAGCSRLMYKAAYHPHERLVDGDWRRFDK